MEIQEGDLTKTHQWSHGLCGCFNNVNICLISWLLPCVTFGQTQDKLLGRSCGLYGCLFAVPILGCILQADQREVLRGLRGIPGSILQDCLMVMFCTPCTLTQEAQEVEQLHAEEFARQAGAEFGLGPEVPTVFGATVGAATNGGTLNASDSHVVLKQPHPAATAEPQSTELQPFEQQNPMVAGLDYLPPSFSTEEAEMNRH